MTETQKINSVLREIFGLPITAEQRLTLFFTWGLFEPLNLNATENARKRREKAAWRIANPEKSAAKNKARYWKDPEKARATTNAWRKENPEQASESHRLWLLENPDRVKAIEARRDKPKKRERMRVYLSTRRQEDVEFRILTNCRTRINQAIKTLSKGAGTRELIGMDLHEYRIYLQGQFLPGMTWENWGSIWEIDHIRPCATFDLTDPAQQRECFNWSNTQPLFADENRRKGANF